MKNISRRFKMGKTKLIMRVLALGVTLAMLTACGNSAGDSDASADGKKTIIFADAGWESIQFHNDIAQFIMEEGYGYKTDILPGSTAATFQGFRQGDIDVYMEVWTDNLVDVYEEAIASGDVKEVSINFDDNAQGLYVPTYMIEGDPEKGIDPVAPDLKTVEDLKKYPELFKDQEQPEKGRIYGAPSGWNVDNIMQAKMETYGLGERYNYFAPGSDTGLSASIAGAVQKSEPWVGYYWEPTWVLGKYDMTLLEEIPYDEEIWDNGYGTTFPPMPVTVAVYKELEQEAPELVEFLSNYKTSSQLTSEALAFMQEEEVGTKEAAIWFFEQHEDLWTTWVPEEIAEKVKTALK